VTTERPATAEAATPPSLAVSYLRVSTKEQAERDGDPEGYSIPAQRDANLRKANSLGAIIAAEFVDRGESARSADRPELKQMLAYIAGHPEVAYVIVHKVDRLARNRVDDIEINLALTKAGVTLVSATENIDETPSGMLLHGIMSSIAEFYSRNLATEVIKGMSQKVKTGGTPGKPPLGYRNARAINSDGREVRTIELDPERAPLIGWAFETYATADWTLARLLVELKLRGLTNTPTPKFPVRPVQLSHLHMILTHPYYKGEVVWKGARYPGRHPRLVDDQTWARVQAVLAAHGPGEKQREHPHYLKSSIFCGNCSSRLIVTYAKNRYGAVYPYYLCLGRHQKRTDCTRKAILIATVEDLIEEVYANYQLEERFREAIETMLKTELSAGRYEAEATARELHTQRQRLTHEQAKLLQAHYAGAVPLDLLKQEQDRISSQLEQIDGRLQATQVEFDTIERNLQRALDFAANCHRAYLAAPPSTRRLLNQALFKKLFIDEDAVRVELAEPFRTLLGPEVRGAAGLLAQAEQPAGESADAESTVEALAMQVTAKQPGDGLTYFRPNQARRTPTRSQAKTSTPDYRGGGLKRSTVVRPAGFEPATS
jgi:site-specific DNA recombinase